MTMNFTRGDVIGAEFEPRCGDGTYIVIRIAVPTDTLVSAGRVVIQGEEDFDRELPTFEDVRGVLAAPAPSPQESKP